MNRTPNIDREIAMMDERFTTKLHRILGAAEDQGFADVIQWDPGGQSFTVYKPEAFAKTVMKKHFRQTKYKSFQRQLNLYDFKRVTRNGIRGVYYHPLFVRSNPYLCQQIKRKTQSATPTMQQTATLQRNEVAIPNFFDIIASETLQSTKDFHESKKEDSNLTHPSGKEKADDDTIETIDGYVDDIEAGALFKVGKPSPSSDSRIER